LHINQAEIANQTSYIHGNESEGPDGPTIWEIKKSLEIHWPVISNESNQFRSTGILCINSKCSFFIFSSLALGSWALWLFSPCVF
jgi:hypothetical protein